jgi:hypothetical protein
MDKTAQKRSLLNKLHEMGNIPAHAAESFFKPELKRVMNTLIDADDVIRSTLAGQKIGKATPEDPVSAKDLLKEAKSLINRREYLSAVANLGRFHKKMQDVSNVLDKLTLNVDSLHHQFLFNKLPSKHRQQLEDFEKRIASERLPHFTKEAGIMDFFHNIGTQRGRALAAWEKRYPQVVAKIRDGAIEQLESSQNLLNEVLTLLKEMASSRASRNIDAYLNTSKQVANSFKKFDTGGKSGGFRGFYNTAVKPWMDKQRQLEQESQAEATSSTAKAVTNMMEEQGKRNLEQEEGVPEFVTPSVILPPPPAMPTGVESTESEVEPAESTVKTPVVPSLPGTEPKFKSDEIARQLFGTKKSSYEAFIDSLEVFANEDPSLLAAHISRYAGSIQAEQPEVAVKLFKIAQSLRG